jgi:hypothetical protein
MVNTSFLGYCMWLNGLYSCADDCWCLLSIGTDCGQIAELYISGCLSQSIIFDKITGTCSGLVMENEGSLSASKKLSRG